MSSNHFILKNWEEKTGLASSLVMSNHVLLPVNFLINSIQFKSCFQLLFVLFCLGGEETAFKTEMGLR